MATVVSPPVVLGNIGVPPAAVIAQLISGVVEITRRVEIYNSDAITPFAIDNWDARLVDGSITVDGTRDERRMCDFTLENNDYQLNLDPINGFWYDKILKVFWGINYYNSLDQFVHWEVQVGEFMIDRIEEDYFPNTCKVTGRDYTKKCLLSDIVNSIQFSNEYPVEQIITALAANSGVAKFRMPYTGLSFSDDVVFDPGTARWAIIKKLADSIGYEVYFTADGYLTMRPYQDPVLSPLVWTFNTDPDAGTLVSFKRSSDDSLVKNHTIVIGATVTDNSGVSTTAFGEAVNDDVSTPTYRARIGDRANIFKSDYITETSDAQALADARLRVMALEQFQVDFSCPILPWLDANDIVDITNPKDSSFVPSRFLLSSYTLPMSLQPMTAVAKRITIAGTTRQMGIV